MVLKMTSGMKVTLIDLLHVLDNRKNLMSGSLLVKHGFILVFETNNFLLTKNNHFTGKEYMDENLFKLNVIAVRRKIDIDNKRNYSIYMLECSDLWHIRVEHINFNFLLCLTNLDLLPKCNIDPIHICEICVEAKMTKTHFHSVEQFTNPLELIHSYIGDLKFVQTRVEKKYYITFIDDCTRYCYVYLLRSKDEVLETFKNYKTEVENQHGK